MSKKLSTYLYESEYRCKCCSELPPSLDLEDIATPFQILFDSFDFIREEWGKAIYVTSGYRCPMHNAMVGGRVLSAHMFGLALDMDCDNIDEVYELADVIEDLCPDLRRGQYTGSGSFIHLDVAYYVYPKASLAWTEGKRWAG